MRLLPFFMLACVEAPEETTFVGGGGSLLGTTTGGSTTGGGATTGGTTTGGTPTTGGTTTTGGTPTTGGATTTGGTTTGGSTTGGTTPSEPVCDVTTKSKTPASAADPAFGEFVFTEVEPGGDLGGFAGDAAAGWCFQDVDPKLVTLADLTGSVEDLESGDSVAEATVEIWHDGEPTSSPDVRLTGDTSGQVIVPVMRCQPHDLRVSTDEDLAETKETTASQQIHEPTTRAATFASVSSSTAALIPALLGVSVDSANGMVMGAALDAQGAPMSGAQVVVRDETGAIPESAQAWYTVSEFPDRDQAETSEDGLWLLTNVPQGWWSVDVYTYSVDTGGHLRMGTALIYVDSDGFSLVDLSVGFDGGRYPAGCLLR